jgi:hypothetical protein
LDARTFTKTTFPHPIASNCSVCTHAM